MRRGIVLFLMVAGGAVLIARSPAGHLQRLFACDIGDPIVEFIASWPRDQYLLVYFQDDDGTASKAAEPLREALKRYGSRANVKPVPSRVESNSVEGSPAVLISPRGAVLACFDEAPEAGEVSVLFESPGRTALVEALKEHDSVFLCLLDQKSESGKQTLKVLKNALRLVRELSELSTVVLVVDPSQPKEEYLVRNIRAQTRNPQSGDAQPVVALVCGSGRLADVTLGVPSEEQVIDRLQRIYREGGYTDPSRFGEDLLLVW